MTLITKMPERKYASPSIITLRGKLPSSRSIYFFAPFCRLGLSQYGDLHFGHTLGWFRLLGQSCPHRRHL
jgi:hypothetical protein